MSKGQSFKAENKKNFNEFFHLNFYYFFNFNFKFNGQIGVLERYIISHKDFSNSDQ